MTTPHAAAAREIEEKYPDMDRIPEDSLRLTENGLFELEQVIQDHFPPVRWTRTKPDEAGWWWLKVGDSEPKIIKLTQGIYGGKDCLVHVSSGYVDGYVTVDWYCEVYKGNPCLWSSQPLQPPEGEA